MDVIDMMILIMYMDTDMALPGVVPRGMLRVASRKGLI